MMTFQRFKIVTKAKWTEKIVKYFAYIHEMTCRSVVTLIFIIVFESKHLRTRTNFSRMVLKSYKCINSFNLVASLHWTLQWRHATAITNSKMHRNSNTVSGD